MGLQENVMTELKAAMKAKLKNLVKEKLITEDDEHRGQEVIQKVTDQHVKEIDQRVEQKEKELMTF